jgi:hypothetical protein
VIDALHELDDSVPHLSDRPGSEVGSHAISCMIHHLQPAAAEERLRNSPALAAAVQREIDRRLSAELYRIVSDYSGGRPTRCTMASST